MRIGVLGAGHVGTTLSKQFALIGHEVSLGGLLVPRTVRGVAAFADVAVVAIPFGRHLELPVTELAGKAVIDTTNYDPVRDGPIPELDDDRTTSSELLQQHLRDAYVVKALNTVGWEQLRTHAYRDRLLGRRGIPLSGDDVKAKKTAMALVEELGFDSVDVGDLAGGGRKHQPGTEIFTADLTARGIRARLHLPT